MQQFNLSKFYTLNWLLWTSLNGNFFIVILYCCLFEIKNSYDVTLFFYFLEHNLLCFFLLLIFILFTIAIETILRKVNILNSYNKLSMPLKIRTILYWFAIVFILLDFILFRITFYAVRVLNAPYPPNIHP